MNTNVKSGNLVVVGSNVDGAFQLAAGISAKVVVDKIESYADSAKIYLNWFIEGKPAGRSYVFAHDEGKTWKKIEDHN